MLAVWSVMITMIFTLCVDSLVSDGCHECILYSCTRVQPNIYLIVCSRTLNCDRDVSVVFVRKDVYTLIGSELFLLIMTFTL